jgi:hypothetical protein
MDNRKLRLWHSWWMVGKPHLTPLLAVWTICVGEQMLTFRYATFAVKDWTDFSLKFVQYLHTKFQYLSAAMLQLNIGKPLEI